MDREILERIMTAKAYQKEAIYALFPKEMSGHLEVIETEIRMMAMEFIRSWTREQEKDRNADKDYESSKDINKSNINANKNESYQMSGARKIDIT